MPQRLPSPSKSCSFPPSSKRGGGGNLPHNGITNRLPLPTLLHQMAAARLPLGTTGSLVLRCNMGPALPSHRREPARVLPPSTADEGRTSVGLGKISVGSGWRERGLSLCFTQGKKTLCPRLSKVWKEWTRVPPSLKAIAFLQPSLTWITSRGSRRAASLAGLSSPGFSPSPLDAQRHSPLSVRARGGQRETSTPSPA